MWSKGGIAKWYLRPIFGSKWVGGRWGWSPDLVWMLRGLYFHRAKSPSDNNGWPHHFSAASSRWQRKEEIEEIGGETVVWSRTQGQFFLTVLQSTIQESETMLLCGRPVSAPEISSMWWISTPTSPKYLDFEEKEYKLSVGFSCRDKSSLRLNSLGCCASSNLY